ncbi:MAG: DNA repair protein RecO (recombination protein O) [Parcubacteria group bacterium Athens0714_16]|nr:MAG: DNA repair protein RecO (recombination protein O) [Parcubacteria group bacterium Athens0714_16]
MYQIYTTEGLIIESRIFGESNKIYFILTRDFGLIKATAQGVCKTESKQKFGLQTLSFSKISLVKGRDIWKITSAISLENVFSNLKGEKNKLNVFIRIVSLIRKLLVEEEKEPIFFDVIKSLYKFLKTEDSNNRDKLSSAELLTVMKILHTSGYLGENKNFGDLLGVDDFGDETMNNIKKIKREMLKEVNLVMQEI